MTQTTRYKLSRPEEYIKNGETKTTWFSVGTLTHHKQEDGSESRIVEIPAIGLRAFAFPFEDTNDNSSFSKPQEEKAKESTVEDTTDKDSGLSDDKLSGEEIEEIPF